MCENDMNGEETTGEIVQWARHGTGMQPTQVHSLYLMWSPQFPPGVIPGTEQE